MMTSCPMCLRNAALRGEPPPERRSLCANGWHFVGWVAPFEQLPYLVDACRAMPGVARVRYEHTDVGAARGVQLWFCASAADPETVRWWETVRAYERAAHPERYCVECGWRLAHNRAGEPYRVCLSMGCGLSQQYFAALSSA